MKKALYIPRSIVAVLNQAALASQGKCEYPCRDPKVAAGVIEKTYKPTNKGSIQRAAAAGSWPLFIESLKATEEGQKVLALVSSKNPTKLLALSNKKAQEQRSDLLQQFPFLSSQELANAVNKHSSLNPEELQEMLKAGPEVIDDDSIEGVAKFTAPSPKISINREKFQKLDPVMQEAAILHEVLHYVEWNTESQQQSGASYLQQPGEKNSLALEIAYLREKGLNRDKAKQLIVNSLPEEFTGDAEKIFSETWG